jgi:hypothetical protein
MHSPTQPPLFPAPAGSGHLICSWCHRDMGRLPFASSKHSYGICTTCQYTYFAEFYAVDAGEAGVKEGLCERAVGMNTIQ